MSIADILSAPPGGLVYHLVTLFAIQAVLGMALDEWLRHEQPQYRRLAIVFGILLLSRILLMMFALVTWQGFLPAPAVLPPLERFLDLISLVLIFYVVISQPNPLTPFNRIFCFVNLGLAIVVYIVFAVLWYSSFSWNPALHYNGSWQEWVWEIWQILVLIWALFVTSRYRFGQKGLFLSIFSFLLLGHIMHLILPQMSIHIAGWERLANLIAYPLLAVATYRSIIEILASGREPVPREFVRTQEVRRTVPVEAAQSILETLDLPVVLERATRNVLADLGVELSAIVIRRIASSQNLQVAAVGHSNGLYETDKGDVNLASLPTIRRALQRQKRLLLDTESGNAGELHDLIGLLGASSQQHLMIEPLIKGETAFGILVIGDSSLQKLSSLENSRLSQIWAGIIASAVGNALLHQIIETQLFDLDRELQEFTQSSASTMLADEPDHIMQAEDDFAEQLQVELLQAQLELEKARQEMQARISGSDNELFQYFQEELSRTRLELGTARRELLEQMPQADLRSFERLQKELERAQRSLDQARKELQEQVGLSDVELVEELRTELEQTHRKLSQARNDFEEQAVRLKDETAERERLQSQLEDLRFEFEKIRQGLQERTADLEAKAAESARLQLKLDRMQEELDRAQKSLREQTAESEANAAENKRLREELDRTQSELEQTRQTSREQATELSAEFARSQGLQAELKRLTIELEQIHRESQSRVSPPDSGSGEQKSSRSEPERGQQQLKQTRRDLQEQTPDLNAVFDQIQWELHHLDGQKAPVSLERQGQDERLNMDFVEHLQNELQKAHRELDRLSRELQTRTSEAEVGLIEHLQSELAQAQFDLEQMRENMRRTEEMVQAQERELIERVEQLSQQKPEKTGGQAQKENLASPAIRQELRMSLNVVRGYADLLLGGSLGSLAEAQLKYLQRIKSNIDRMRNVLSNLDMLATIDAGELRITPAEVGIRLLLDKVIEYSRPQIEEKQIKLILDIPEELPPVRADAAKLEQIVGNLLNNALKTSSLGSEVKISAKVRRLDDEVHHVKAPCLSISVQDAGGGIKISDPDKVFGRFAQTDKNPISGLGERGAGLAVAKSLIEAHQGQIWFDNDPGHGATFTFCLPLNDSLPYTATQSVRETKKST